LGEAVTRRADRRLDSTASRRSTCASCAILGHPLSLDELIRARDHGVSAAYVRDLSALGYPRVSLDTLIRLRDHGVSPEYVRELKDLGYAQLAIDDLTGLRDSGVTPDRVRSANARAGARLSVDQLKAAAARGWR